MASGSIIGCGFLGGNRANIFWGFALISVNSLVFEGLLQVHACLANPFTDDVSGWSTTNNLNMSIESTSFLVKCEEGRRGLGRAGHPPHRP